MSAQLMRRGDPVGGQAGDSLERPLDTRGGRLAIRDLVAEFPSSRGLHRVLDELTLAIEPGEFVCLLGPTGCGKSTLLSCIAGFVTPARGSVQLDGVAIRAPGPERGMVFQHHSLFPWKTVRENVAFGPRMAGFSRWEANARADQFLGLVGLAASADQYPQTLSGGMQQRVGIARALANHPKVLLMDEPFGALDAQTRSMMQESLAQLWGRWRSTVVFVTHDVDEAVFLADRVIVMSATPGRLIADVRVALARPRGIEVLTAPAFIEIKRQCLELIRGETLRSLAQHNQ